MSEVGSLRAAGFSKYLPMYGWNPIILTIKNPDPQYCNPISSLPIERGVFRAPSLFSLSYLSGKANGLLSRFLRLFGKELGSSVVPSLLLIPDFAQGWIPPAVIKGVQLIRKKNIDAIFATSKPNTASIVGTLLSKLTGVPLVLDFRDPWRKIIFQLAGYKGDGLNYTIPDWRDSIDRPLETAVLKRAGQVIFTTEDTKNIYEMVYPFIRGRTHTIYNGYSENFFENQQPESFTKFTIVYSGNFYFELDYSEAFFQALQQIKDKNELSGEVRFLYIGKNPDMELMINKYNLHEISKCTGVLERDEAIKTMRRASVLLLRNIAPCLSTKIFEGLAAGLPILATIDEGEATTLIRRYASNSFIANSRNIKEIKDAIKLAFKLWDENKLERLPSQIFRQKFSKENLTMKLAAIFEKIN